MPGMESVERGGDFARRFAETAHEPLPLADPRVQVYLAKLLYPNEPKPMEKWLMGDETLGVPPLSDTFRTYIDSHPGTVDIGDESALYALLEAVRGDSKSALH